MEENLNLNEGQENVVDSQTDVESVTNEIQSTSESVNGESATPQKETKPAQSPEENAKFAEMRRAREAAEARSAQIERDYNISRQYGANYGVHSESEIAEKYGSQGITTLEQFEYAVKEAEMREQGIEPDVIKKYAEDLPEVKEAKQMKRDRESMAALKEIAPEITDASQIPTEVIQQYIQGKDLAAAYAVWKLKADNANKAAEAAKAAEAEAKAKANAENAKGSMGPVTGDGVANDTDYVSYDDYEKNKSNQSWVNKNFDKIMKSRTKW